MPCEYQPIPTEVPQFGSVEDELPANSCMTRPRQRWYQSVSRSKWLWPMLPWCVTAAFGKTERQLPKKSSTSYLNGLRGIACIVVYIFHVMSSYYSSFIYSPYGAPPAEENHGISQLPIIRVIYAGKGMVMIFFILSGFVLSYSPLRKINESSLDQSNEILTGLCSSILRRGIRLFAPMIVLVLLSCLATWIYPDYSPGNWRWGDPTFLQHLWRFILIAAPAFNPFTWEVYFPLSLNQCWTLPVEFRGSMVVFLMCLATSRLTSRARKFVISSLTLTALVNVRLDVFCFLFGMIMAEERHHPLFMDLPIPKWWKVPRLIIYTLASLLLLLSMLFLGWPENGDSGIEPFKTLADFMPQHVRANNETATFFWGSIGAAGLFVALENLPPIQSLLSSTVIRYLGEISFSFYLLHWLSYHWLGANMMIFFMWTLGWGQVLSFYVMFFMTLALCIIASDYYWRIVDENCIILSKGFVNWLGVHDAVTVPKDEAIELVEDELGSEEGTRFTALQRVNVSAKVE